MRVVVACSGSDELSFGLGGDSCCLVSVQAVLSASCFECTWDGTGGWGVLKKRVNNKIR